MLNQDLPSHHNGGKAPLAPKSTGSTPVWCGGLVESISGIRGIYGQSITKELARKYALSYCQLFGSKLSSLPPHQTGAKHQRCSNRQSQPPLWCGGLVVGGDSRASTPILKETMLQAFKDCGVKRIIDVGTSPVQVAEYAIQKFGADGGVYITASHNEPECNGWKFLKEDGALLYSEQSEKLIAMRSNFQQEPKMTKQTETEIIDKHEQAIEQYINYVLEKIGEEAIEKIKKSNFKILVDPNGGAGITILGKLFAQLGVKAKIINNQLGKFMRLVEPNVESLTPLAQELLNDEFEFACGFDCDADRVEFVISPHSNFAQEAGPVLDGNYVLALACDIQLQGTENQVVVTNTVTSPLVCDIVKKHRATVQEAELGEMYVVQEMEAQNSIIGGEGSNGGVIIPPIKCRDGIMTVALILKMLAETGKPLPLILESYPKYYSTRTALSCLPEESIVIQDKLEQYFKEKGCQTQRTRDLKVWIDNNSYVWLHQSGTEPGTFRIIVDGDNHQKVRYLLQQAVEAFNKFKEIN